MVFFLFGFVSVVFMKLNMIALTMVAAMVALIYFFAISNSGGTDGTSKEANGDNSEIDEEEF